MRYFPIILMAVGCSKVSDGFVDPAELATMPMVADAEVKEVESPQTQIIHILDWHHVDREVA